MEISHEVWWFLGIVGTIVLFTALRPIVWSLFRFDDKVAKIISEKKSSEVRVGRIVESLAPLLEGFPVDVRKRGSSTHFLGQPIDYIHFDPEEGITFIEVKSGNSTLSYSQRQLKQCIELGKVRWVSFKVPGGR